MENKHSGQGGAHYKNNESQEVCVAMENEHFNVFKHCRNSGYSIEQSLKKALWSASAVKHELRAGTKEGNTVEQERGKAENYRHRQETGEWKQQIDNK
jgi:hypothetical protein